jgi:hypothetical protein
MKRWNVRSWKYGDRGTVTPKVLVNQRVVEAQIKTEALREFFRQHPEDRVLVVTAAPIKETAR